jgi:hypothetical protein
VKYVRGALSLVSTTEELLDTKVAAPVYKTEITAVGIRRADHATPLYPQKLALTSLTSGSRSVGTVRSRTQATEFVFDYLVIVSRQLISHTLPSRTFPPYKTRKKSIFKAY